MLKVLFILGFIVIILICYVLLKVILFTKTDLEFEEKFYKANKLYKE